MAGDIRTREDVVACAGSILEDAGDRCGTLGYRPGRDIDARATVDLDPRPPDRPPRRRCSPARC